MENCKEVECNYKVMWLGEENKILLISGHISHIFVALLNVQVSKLLIIDIVAVTWQVLFSVKDDDKFV